MSDKEGNDTGDLLSPPLSFIFFFLLLPPFILVFLFLFYFFRYSPIRSTILAFMLCICPSTFLLYCSSHSWPLVLFVSCVFAMDKNFLLFRYALMIIYKMKISHV